MKYWKTRIKYDLNERRGCKKIMNRIRNTCLETAIQEKRMITVYKEMKTIAEAEI